jgi:hypothetical protein
VLITVPPPAALPDDELEAAIRQALEAADQAGIKGKEITPFLVPFLQLGTDAFIIPHAGAGVLFQLGRRMYFDHLIFALHFHTAAYITLALILPLEDATSQYWLAIVAQFALVFYLIAYLLMALRRVYNCSWAGAATKSIGILLGYLVMVSMVIETASSFLILGD